VKSVWKSDWLYSIFHSHICDNASVKTFVTYKSQTTNKQTVCLVNWRPHQLIITSASIKTSYNNDNTNRFVLHCEVCRDKVAEDDASQKFSHVTWLWKYFFPAIPQQLDNSTQSCISATAIPSWLRPCSTGSCGGAVQSLQEATWDR